MIRTQITLDEHDYRLAQKESRALGVSVAEFVRRSIRRSLPAEPASPDAPGWMRYAGLVESGDPNSSGTVDELVYGNKHYEARRR
jgi:hypothetical protein